MWYFHEERIEFLDYQLKSVMKDGWSYVKGSRDFFKKIKTLEKFSENTILVTGYIVNWYPSIPQWVGLNVLKKIFDHREIDLFLQRTYNDGHKILIL